MAHISIDVGLGASAPPFEAGRPPEPGPRPSPRRVRPRGPRGPRPSSRRVLGTRPWGRGRRPGRPDSTGSRGPMPWPPLSTARCDRGNIGIGQHLHQRRQNVGARRAVTTGTRAESRDPVRTSFDVTDRERRVDATAHRRSTIASGFEDLSPALTIRWPNDAVNSPGSRFPVPQGPSGETAPGADRRPGIDSAILGCSGPENSKR